MIDPIVGKMRALGLEMTRNNYLHLAYFGQPPDELDAEQEAAIPMEFQSRRNGVIGSPIYLTAFDRELFRVMSIRPDSPFLTEQERNETAAEKALHKEDRRPWRYSESAE